MDKRISHSEIILIIFSLMISPMLASSCRHVWIHINVQAQNFMFRPAMHAAVCYAKGAEERRGEKAESPADGRCCP